MCSGTQENAFLIFFGKECLQKQKKILLMIYYQGTYQVGSYVFMNIFLQNHCVLQSICTCVEGNKIEIEGGQDIKSEKYVVFDLLKTFFFILYILLMSCFFQKYLHLDSFLKMSDSAGLKIHYTVCTYNFAFCLQLLFLYLVFGIGQHVKTQIFVLSTLEFTQILMSQEYTTKQYTYKLLQLFRK